MHIYSKKILSKCFLMLSALLATILFTSYKLNADVSDCGSTAVSISETALIDRLYFQTVDTEIDNEYLVVWSGNEKRRRLLLPLTPISIPIVGIFGQRIDGLTGGKMGENDFPISKVSGIAIASVLIPDVSYDFRRNEYLVAWDGANVGFTDSSSNLLKSTFEIKFNSIGIFGQRIDGITGNALRPNVFRINSSGDGLIKPTIAYNSQENEYMVIWKRQKQETVEEVDDNGCSAVLSFFHEDLFGQRINAATSEIKKAEDFKLANDLRNSIFSVAYNTNDNEYLIV